MIPITGNLTGAHFSFSHPSPSLCVATKGVLRSCEISWDGLRTCQSARYQVKPPHTSCRTWPGWCFCFLEVSSRTDFVMTSICIPSWIQSNKMKKQSHICVGVWIASVIIITWLIWYHTVVSMHKNDWAQIPQSPIYLVVQATTVRFLDGVTFLWPGGWNLSLSWSDTPCERIIKCHHWLCDVVNSGFLHSWDAERCLTWQKHLHPSGGHRYTKSFSSVAGVAYPLTGTLLLISQSSADCISSVRSLPSHPRGVYVTRARWSICLPTVERHPTCWARRPRTHRPGPWTLQWNLTAKRCHTKLELMVSLDHYNLFKRQKAV